MYFQGGGRGEEMFPGNAKFVSRIVYNPSRAEFNKGVVSCRRLSKHFIPRSQSQRFFVIEACGHGFPRATIDPRGGRVPRGRN